MTKYSFTLETPKRFVNKKIFVEANSPKEAKKLILLDLQKINRLFVKVYELTSKEVKLEKTEKLIEKNGWLKTKVNWNSNGALK